MSRSKVSPEEGSTKRKGLDPARVAAARRRIELSGTNISDWARRRGFDIKLVHEVLSGHRPCTRGQSYRIAILLDLKDGALDDIDQRLGGSPVGNADHE
jgi:gp16 family phage-associated protein